MALNLPSLNPWQELMQVYNLEIIMKNNLKIFILGLLLSLGTAFSQTNADNFQALVGSEPTVEINLGPTMLSLLSSATEEEQGISSILSGLDAIKVTVFDLEKSKNLSSIKSKISTLADAKISAGFEKIATVREDDSLVYVLAKMNDKHFKKLSVFALDDDDELVLIEIDGTILMSQLGALMEHFDVDLDVNGMKFKKQKKKDQ
jgi:hypothetical protein